mgnify:CR=1 FL=1|tara:strand:+ start:905 stop:1096 length:192 start_codon:yes stop_codon:yes gene_type:complete
MSTNSFVAPCGNCGENTCVNNVSTRPPYHNLECWSCGFFSIAKEGYMSQADRDELKHGMEEEE